MQARHGFERAALRVVRLIEAHGTLHGGGQGRPAQQAADVLRGAVVLAAAAVDAYVIDAFVEALPPVAKKGGLGLQAPDLMDGKAWLHAITTGDPTEHLASVARQKFATKTFQRASSIQSHLREYLGYEVPWDDIATRLGHPNGDDARKELNGVVARRNSIAHASDVLPGQNRASAINRPYVERALKVVRATVEEIDDGLDQYIL